MYQGRYDGQLNEENKADECTSITVEVNNYCYYDFENGRYSTNPGWKKTVSHFNSSKVCVIIIDPWKDSPFPELNKAVEENVNTYIIPMVKAQKGRIKTLCFTNNPMQNTYSSKIVDSLQCLVDDGEIELHYYDEFPDADSFAVYMNERGFDTLIYTGYAIEMCVGYRNCGVVQNYCSDYGGGFNRIVIPQACLGIMSLDKKENNTMRDMTVIAYSQQNIAHVIDFYDWIEALKKK